MTYQSGLFGKGVLSHKSFLLREIILIFISRIYANFVTVGI